MQNIGDFTRNDRTPIKFVNMCRYKVTLKFPEGIQVFESFHRLCSRRQTCHYVPKSWSSTRVPNLSTKWQTTMTSFDNCQNSVAVENVNWFIFPKHVYRVTDWQAYPGDKTVTL